MRTQHMLGGAVAPSAPFALAGAGPAVVLAVGSVGAVAGLISDIDHHGSTITKSLGPVTYLAHVAVDRTLGGHRMGTHSLIVGVPLFTVLASVPLAVAGVSWWWVIGAAVLLGATSHTALDCLTGSPGNWETAGCAVWWPISKRRYGVPLMRTGGWQELWLVRPALVAALLIVAWKVLAFT